MALIAAALAFSPSMAQAGKIPGLLPAPRRHRLRPRNDETVILADCRDSAGIITSQMAYFPGAPGPTPQDVAIVRTNPGEAALWINTKTSALFTATNTVFTATLGPKVGPGEYAGSGHNGYGGFSCWEQYSHNLYKYGDTTCSQVYLCDHRELPATLPTPIASTTPTLGGTGVATAASPTATSASQTGAPSSSSGSGLSEGALIGIVVSVVGVVALTVAAAVVYCFWRRLQRGGQRRPYENMGSRGCCGLIGGKLGKKSTSRDGVASRRTELSTSQDGKEIPGGGSRYEMEGHWRAVELADTSDKHEMDASQEAGVASDLKKEQIPDVITSTKWPEEKTALPSEPPRVDSKKEQFPEGDGTK